MKKLLVIWALWVLGLAVYVQAQPRRGQMEPGRQMGAAGGMLALESDWALICFELKVDGRTLIALLPVFQQAWDQRQELMAQMQNGEIDWTAMRAEMTAIQEELEKGCQQILSKEQHEHLVKARADRMDRRGGGGRQGRP